MTARNKKILLGGLTALLILVVVRQGFVAMSRTVIIPCVNNYLFPAEGSIVVNGVEGRIIEYTSPSAQQHLRGVYFESVPNAPTLIFFHGNGETIEPFLSSAATLATSGMHVFLPEYQCYGGMGGARPTEAQMIDAGRSAVFSMGARAIASSGTIIVGRSLGTGIAAAVAAAGYGDALVLLSPFTSTTSVARRYLGSLAQVIVADSFNTERRLSNFDRPLVIMHGTEDEVVPFSEGQRLAAQHPTATFIPIPGAGHNNLPPLEELMARIFPILPEHLRPLTP